MHPAASTPGFEAKADESGLPIIGRVAALAPILAEQHIEQSCNINPRSSTPQADYLLRVHGMSMKDVGILDGDLLAVHTCREARNGQIVVARIGDEVTVKRQREGKVWLLAENPEFAPYRSRPERTGTGDRGLERRRHSPLIQEALRAAVHSRTRSKPSCRCSKHLRPTRTSCLKASELHASTATELFSELSLRGAQGHCQNLLAPVLRELAKKTKPAG